MRAAHPPILRARRGRESASAERDEDDHQDRDSDDGRRAKRGVILVGRGEEGERDDREGEVRQLVPDPGDGDGETDGRRGKSPGPEHRVGAGHSYGRAGRRYGRERRGRLGHREGLPEPEPWQSCHPGRREGRKIEQCRCDQQEPVPRTEPADDVQDLAVVRDTREEEHEDGDDHRDRPRGPEESSVSLRQAPPRRGRAVRHSQEPIVRQIPHSKGEP